MEALTGEQTVTALVDTVVDSADLAAGLAKANAMLAGQQAPRPDQYLKNLDFELTYYFYWKDVLYTKVMGWLGNRQFPPAGELADILAKAGADSRKQVKSLVFRYKKALVRYPDAAAKEKALRVESIAGDLLPVILNRLSQAGIAGGQPKTMTDIVFDHLPARIAERLAG